MLNLRSPPARERLTLSIRLHMEKMRALSNHGSSSVSEGIVADLRPKARLPLSPLTSCHADELGGAEGVEAVHEGDAVAGVVPRPARPECPSVVPHRAQGVVAGACGLSVFFARPPVLSDRDDRSGAAREDGGVAATCIVVAVHCPAGHCAAMSREGPAGSAGHPHGGKGSGRRASFASGTASCNPAQPSPAPPTSAGEPPSRKSGAMAA
jgi:hypothetical protein